MDPSGDVGLLHPAIQDNAGVLDWSVTPLCSSPTGSFSVFSFDAQNELASNNALLTVDRGTCNVPPLSGTISTVAGNNIAGYSGDGGLATDAELSLPTGAVFDGANNMFVADFHNNAIRVVEKPFRLHFHRIRNRNSRFFR